LVLKIGTDKKELKFKVYDGNPNAPHSILTYHEKGCAEYIEGFSTPGFYER
jgi:hypothetical protein